MGKKYSKQQFYGEAWSTRWNIRGRQLMLWVSHSSSGYFNMTPANQKEVLYAGEMKDIYNGTAWILTLELFERTNEPGVFKRKMLPGETPFQFFHRATTKVNTKFALVWKLDRLLLKKGCAEHSNQEFAEELGRDVSWISRYLKKIVAEGIVNRYGGNKGGGPKMYYCNPGDEQLNRELLERYGEHEEDDWRGDVRKDSYEPIAKARETKATKSTKTYLEEDIYPGPVIIKLSKKDRSIIK